MATLELKTAGFEPRLIELRPGINRLGRSPNNDVRLDHSTVSAHHCEVILGCGELSVRDCASTNGTFLDGAPVRQAVVAPGQTLRVGAVELLVAGVDIPVSIPRFDAPTPPLPAVLNNGLLPCRRHPATALTFRCSHCGELLCDFCLHRLRRRGGKLLLLCPLCSYPAQPLGGDPKPKRSLFQRLFETTKMFFARAPQRN
jgi:hypothetical protein